MNENQFTLKPEQEFELIKFRNDVLKLNEQEAKELLIQMYAQSMVRQNYFNQLLKTEWGL